MTREQEQILLGIHAEQLLDHQSFDPLMNEMVESISKSILATAPADKEGRETLYLMFTGLEEFRKGLLQHRDLKNSILRQREENDDEQLGSSLS